MMLMRSRIAAVEEFSDTESTANGLIHQQTWQQLLFLMMEGSVEEVR
jgi:hypothetical protein